MIKNIIKRILNFKSGYDSPVGRKNRQNREFWIETKLKEIPEGTKLLDAGAGEMPYKTYCEHLQYVSQDFGKFEGNKDSIGIHESKNWNTKGIDILSDIINIPVEANSFDAVLCTEVFEHIPNPINAISEFHRILKPKGVLIITAPTISLTHQEPYYYYSGFSKYFYEKHLQESGFKIDEIKENGNYFDFIAQELRRVNAVAKEYGKEKRTGKEIKATGTVLKMLHRFSQKGNDSKHLMSYGYHIKAVKKDGK